MRNACVFLGILSLVVILILLLRNNDVAADTTPTTTNDKTQSLIKELFTNSWVFKIDSKSCKSKWNLSAPEITHITFKNPTSSTVTMKLESKDSKGENTVKYTLINHNTIVLSTFEGQELFSIRNNEYIRLLHIEKEITNNEIFECKLVMKKS